MGRLQRLCVSGCHYIARARSYHSAKTTIAEPTAHSVMYPMISQYVTFTHGVRSVKTRLYESTTETLIAQWHR